MAWTAPARAAEEVPSNATLVRNLDIVAFGNEYTGKRYETVRKWAGPIRIGIQGKAYPDYLEADVNEHVAELKRLTGHPIELYYSFALQKAKKLPPGFDAKQVNVILFYGPKETLPAAMGKYFPGGAEEVRKLLPITTCFANYGTKASEIKWAVVGFPEGLPRHHMRACVVEELTQILGLPNDSTHVAPSIFNDKSHHLDLTDHDRFLVRVLYDKRITPGMARESALRAARTILEEMRPGK